MKTARKLCEEIKNKQLQNYIDCMSRYGGKLSFFPNEKGYDPIHFNDGVNYFYLYSPTQEVKKELEKLGYSFSEFDHEFTIYLDNTNPWYKSSNARKVKITKKGLQISACCGQDDNSK
jgi:hypothetical protein